jgi:hypothetical protein
MPGQQKTSHCQLLEQFLHLTFGLNTSPERGLIVR